MSNWPFPAVEKTTVPGAAAILGGKVPTPDELEQAIKAQGQLDESLVNRGKNRAARQAFETVKLLHGMRTPEAVAAMERSRGLDRA
jgi:hypothetical protein